MIIANFVQECMKFMLVCSCICRRNKDNRSIKYWQVLLILHFIFIVNNPQFIILMFCMKFNRRMLGWNKTQYVISAARCENMSSGLCGQRMPRSACASSLIRIFTRSILDCQRSNDFFMRTTKADQTARMRRLILCLRRSHISEWTFSEVTAWLNLIVWVQV